MRTLFSILMVIAAVLLFVFIVAPRMSNIRELRAEEAKLAEALDNARKLEETRQELLNRYNAFETEDLDRMKIMLPDNIDNVKLIIEINALATEFGLALQNVSVKDTEKAEQDVEVINAEGAPYGTVQLNFSIRGQYQQFVRFLEELERSLRIIDVRELSFQTTTTSDVYQYTMVIETYWLQ